MDDPGIPTAGDVVGAALARSARRFLVHDAAGDGPTGGIARRVAGTRPVIGSDLPSAGPESSSAGAESSPALPPDPVEGVHQSRVALRRIRSNLRTFRVLFDPSWNTSLRAELAWYAEALGATRDLHVLRDSIDGLRTGDLGPGDVAPFTAMLDRALDGVDDALVDARAGERHAALVRTLTVLATLGDPSTPPEAVPFKRKAASDADELLPALLERTWRDVRESARTARHRPTDPNLHALRIRLKGLRYGCETVAPVAGGPARKTARAAERLQERLGRHHDACVAAEWLAAAARDVPDLAPVAQQLRKDQLRLASAERSGWKKEWNEVERCFKRWRR